MTSLSQEQIDKLRNSHWPYSEVNIKIEDRLLDNYSSSQFISVYANINPLTFEVAKQNMAFFENRIQWLLQTAHFEWQTHGYVVSNFQEQVNYEDIHEIVSTLNRAQNAKQELTFDVIQLHYFVMDLLGIEYWKQS